ncbi:MAG: acyl carrier protein [Acidimicrobiales bacterium]
MPDDQIAALVASICEVPIDSVRPDDTLIYLGVDSLGLAVLLDILGEEGVHVPDQVDVTLLTVADLEHFKRQARSA